MFNKKEELRIKVMGNLMMENIELKTQLETARDSLDKLRIGYHGRSIPYYEKRVDELKAACPPTFRLRQLADWIDIRHPNDPNPEIQNDLRSWADRIDKATKS